MATFGELITSCSKRLLDTSNVAVSASDVADALNTAIKFYKFQRLWFNEAYESTTLYEASTEITLPSDFLVEMPEDGFTIVDNDTRYTLQKVDSAEFNRQKTDGTGLPYIYVYRGGAYEIYYIPDQDYTLETRYLRDYSPFATDGTDNGQSNDFTTYADQLILYDALSRLHGEFRQDEKMETYYSARAKNELDNLQLRTRKQNSSGILTVETIL